MQNIDLICVGKLNAKYFAEGVAEYQKRLAAFASFRIIALRVDRSLPRSWPNSSPTVRAAGQETWPLSSARPTALPTR